MMTSLRNASRRGATIISFNPFRERALERFQAPQSPIEMATLASTHDQLELYQVRVGGDVAALKGMMKVLVEADEAARAQPTSRECSIGISSRAIPRHRGAGRGSAARRAGTTIERQSGLDARGSRIRRATST